MYLQQVILTYNLSKNFDQLVNQLRHKSKKQRTQHKVQGTSSGYHLIQQQKCNNNQSSVFQSGLGQQSNLNNTSKKNHYHETFLVNFSLF